jgi:hypothetical protein
MDTAPSMASMGNVQMMNLVFLLAIQASLNKDTAEACYKFGLRADDGPLLEGLKSLERINGVAGNLDRSAFTLRDDFKELLFAPPGLVNVYAAVRDTSKSTPPGSE